MVNSVHLVGRLGKDPELRKTAKDKSVCTFSLATDGYGKDAPADWHNIVVWEKQAENCNEYLHKGSMVFVGGRIVTRKYDDKEGITRYRTEIIAHTVKFLDSKRRESESHEEAAPAEAANDGLPF